MDYSAWVDRARRFLRSLAHLPLPLSVHCSICGPHRQDPGEWLHTEECSLPPELRRFLSTASERCCFGYSWRMTEDVRRELEGIVPAGTILSGGGDLCEGAKYSNYDHREFFDGLFPMLGEQAQAAFEAMMPEDLRAAMESQQIGTPDFFGIIQQDFGRSLNDPLRSRGLIPLLEVHEIDWEAWGCVRSVLEPPESWKLALTLCLESDSVDGERRVLCVDASSHMSQVICESLDEFLLAWEQASYLTPTREMLGLWSDSTGRLSPNPGNARQLREVLHAAAAPREKPPWT